MPTSYEITRHYLRGQAAVLRLFEQPLGTTLITPRAHPRPTRRGEGAPSSEEVGRLAGVDAVTLVRVFGYPGVGAAGG